MTAARRIGACLALVPVLAAPSIAQDELENLPRHDGQEADMSQPVQVYILMGQSNMLGFGKVAGLAEAPGSGGLRGGFEAASAATGTLMRAGEPLARTRRRALFRPMRATMASSSRPSSHGIGAPRGGAAPSPRSVARMRSLMSGPAVAPRSRPLRAVATPGVSPETNPPARPASSPLPVNAPTAIWAPIEPAVPTALAAPPRDPPLDGGALGRREKSSRACLRGSKLSRCVRRMAQQFLVHARFKT